MKEDTQKIECPNCGFELDVNEILYQQLDSELRQKYNDELAKEKKKFDQQQSAIDAARKELETEKEKVDEQIADRVKAGLAAERQKMQERLKKELEEEQAERFKELQVELNRKSEQVKDLNKSKAEIEKLKREKDELRDAIELETQKKLNVQLATERERIRKIEEEKATLAVSEKDIVINQLKEQLREASKKAEQGSMQLQGEVQELAIEDWLREQFPLDTIEEIKKGARGGDCLQHIHTRSRQQCGTVYYESKRTKAFQSGWIEKFKNDIRERGADTGVLVTEAMPSDMDRMGLVDGVWVCTFAEFKGLAHVLRESLIEVSRAVTTQENRGDKMVLNTNNMYSSVKGIAGNAVQSVPQLELSAGNDED